MKKRFFIATAACCLFGVLFFNLRGMDDDLLKKYAESFKSELEEGENLLKGNPTLEQLRNLEGDLEYIKAFSLGWASANGSFNFENRQVRIGDIFNDLAVDGQSLIVKTKERRKQLGDQGQDPEGWYGQRDEVFVEDDEIDIEEENDEADEQEEEGAIDIEEDD